MQLGDIAVAVALGYLDLRFPDLDWHRRALAELCRVSRREVRLYPAHTIALDAVRHPYAEALLAELPASWRGRFVSSRYDQGHQGCTEALHLERGAP